MSVVPEPRIIQRIRAAADAGAALLPVHARFGVRAVSAEIGRVEVAQRMGGYCLDRHGRLSPGAFLVGGDTALGSAIASRLTDNLSVVSLTIHFQFVRMDPGAAHEFRLQAQATHIGEHSGSATGQIVDDTGRPVAHMSTHCAFVRNDTPPPVSPGFPLNDSQLTLTSGGPDEELAPLAATQLGARAFAAENGELAVAAMSTPDMCNSRGDLQGGVLGLLAEQAVSACLIRGTPALAVADAMDLDITYLRAVRPDHPHIRIVARAEHASRRFAVAHGVGHDDSGRAVVSVSGSRYRG
jgi:uncharacterized protein (TIGR00369 family)